MHEPTEMEQSQGQRAGVWRQEDTNPGAVKGKCEGKRGGARNQSTMSFPYQQYFWEVREQSPPHGDTEQHVPPRVQ